MVNRAVARRGDPATSWAAAESLDPDTIGHDQRIVWATIQDHGPMTDEDLVDLVGGVMSASGARTRRRELADLGLVFDTGRTVVLRSGRRGIVWGARWLSPTPITFGW